MKFLKKYVLHILLGMVVVIMSVSLLLTKRNNNEIKSNLLLKSQAEEIMQQNSLILREVLHGVDLGLRGYAITGKVSLLQPMKNAENYNRDIFEKLNTELISQKFDTKELKLVHEQVNRYIDFCEGMALDVQNNNMAAFVEKLNEDKGFFAWKAWDEHTQKLHKFEDNLIATANHKVEKAMVQNLWLKVILLAFSIPTFGFAIFIVYLQKRNRRKLLLDLDETNRNYLFNSGLVSKYSSEYEILHSSKVNMMQTAEFVKKVASGNYQNVWEGYNDSNKVLNEHTIAGELLQMQKQMEEVKQRDAKRLWSTEGLAKFSELLRNNQANKTELATKSVSFLTKHLGGLQACLYVKKFDSEQKVSYLELATQYAYDATLKRNDMVYEGEGLVGQAFKNKKSIQLDDIPDTYSRIGSGIGTSFPKSVLIVPFKFQEVVEAVFEISSFSALAENEREFLEKAGEYFVVSYTA